MKSDEFGLVVVAIILACYFVKLFLQWFIIQYVHIV